MDTVVCSRCGALLGRREGARATCAACLLSLGLLDGDDTPTDPPVPPGAPRLPDRVGAFRILDLLGEGGMGTVYLAEQEAPVRRQVALKVVKRGMDTARILARFEAERQALALMDHPGIARIFEAGETADGRPWFSMEHVPGAPITVFADRQRLTTEERLTLFASVCDAVQHAHQKGIIHRDLKPSNILVSERDGGRDPKIIDFGIAKAVGQRLADESIVTELGVALGTPDYMSPERLALSPHGVDTRSDIYSLGVILYELIAGHLPFGFRDIPLDEVRRRIREDDPPVPSDRFHRATAASGEVARRRRTDSAALRRRLRGDLDWITLRAMEKVPDRRYPGAAELAADIRRHLTHTPVEARPPSIGYRLGKFVRRHRVGVAAATLALAMLVAFAVTTTVQSRRIAREARTSERVAEFLRNMVLQVDPKSLGHLSVQDLQERIEATQRRSGATEREVQATLASFSTALRGVNPTETGLRLLDDQILARAGKAIEERFAEEPLIAARLNHTLGATYEQLGLFVQAEPLLVDAEATLRRVLGDDHLDTFRAANDLAALYHSQGRLDECERLWASALRAQRRVLGNDHPDTVNTMNNLGAVHYQRGRYDEAERLYVEAIETRKRVLGNEHRDTLSAMNNLALLYTRQARTAEAESLLLATLEAQRRVLEAGHPETLRTMSGLATVLSRQGRHAEAESLLLEALEIRRSRFGSRHPDTAGSLYNLACFEATRGGRVAAMDWLRQALDAGYARAEWMIEDSDLDSLHGLEFDALIERARRNAAARMLEGG